MAGIPPVPSSTADCYASKDGTRTVCSDKDDEVVLVDLVEVYKFKGKWKQQSVTGRKQYINLDDKVDAANEHPEYGRPIWLKARLKWVAGHKTPWPQGKRVFWYSEKHKTNKKGLTKDEKESFSSVGKGYYLKPGPSLTNKDGWTDPVPFYLSLYGGDKFDVYATTSGAYKGGLKAGSYEVWRKFWFQVSQMKDRTGKSSYLLASQATSSITKGYRKAKIVFKEKGPRGKIPHQGNITSDIRAFGKTHFVSDDLVPFKCHIMTCDYARHTTLVEPIKHKATKADWTSPDWHLLWPHGPWKVEAKYLDGKAWKDIPAANIKDPIKHRDKPGLQKVSINFSKLPVSPSAKTPVDLKLKVKVTADQWLGWGGGSPHILLCSGFLRDTTPSVGFDPFQARTTVHEIGHALGLVNMAPAAPGAHNAWEEKDPNHPKHCGKPPAQCAMYWQNSPKRVITFHSSGGIGCNEHLRRQDFSRNKMSRWK